jgi:regulator of sigma E protease
MSVALALAALITLAWLHELGHALAARALHLHVTAVSFGLGPPLGQVRWGDTRILLGLIPFGGYVRVAELVEESGAGNPARPGLAARLAVILAGPLANYAVAVLLGLVVAVTWGVDQGKLEGIEVSQISQHAARMGLQIGDVVVEADGQAIRSTQDLRDRFLAAAPNPVQLAVRRLGQTIVIAVLPVAPDQPGLGARYLPKPQLQRVSVWRAVQYALREPIRQAAAWLGRLPRLAAISAPTRALGPVGLADRVARSGSWDVRRALVFCGRLAVVVGLFNLLPIPGLDGGRAGLALCEAVLRRRLPPRAALVAQLTGALALFLAWAALLVMDLVALWARH